MRIKQIKVGLKCRKVNLGAPKLNKMHTVLNFLFAFEFCYVHVSIFRNTSQANLDTANLRIDLP